MKIKIKYMGGILLAITLSGCTQLSQKKAEVMRRWSQDYHASYVIAPLKIPENLSYPPTTENYPLPEGLPPSGSVAEVSIVPPGFGAML